jgi:hypothetical protein
VPGVYYVQFDGYAHPTVMRASDLERVDAVPQPASAGWRSPMLMHLPTIPAMASSGTDMGQSIGDGITGNTVGNQWLPKTAQDALRW